MSEVINASRDMMRRPSRKFVCPFRTHEVSFDYIAEGFVTDAGCEYTEIIAVGSINVRVLSFSRKKRSCRQLVFASVIAGVQLTQVIAPSATFRNTSYPNAR